LFFVQRFHTARLFVSEAIAKISVWPGATEMPEYRKGICPVTERFNEKELIVTCYAYPSAPHEAGHGRHREGVRESVEIDSGAHGIKAEIGKP
jgi:hypothetical protein